jgi:iron complex transport system permease protein
MKKRTVFALLAVLASGAIVLGPFAGMQTIPLATALHSLPGSVESRIFWEMRVPRVIVAFLAGSALAVSGMTFQALFRNPLATPFTLGVSSGAAFGAALAVVLGGSFSLLGLPGITLGSLIGALFSIAAVYGFARIRRGFSTAVMLLAGVAMSFLFSSMILFLQYLSDFTQSFRIVRWLMGGIETVGTGTALMLAPFVVIGVGIILFHSDELNLVSAGEDIAASRGVNLARVKTVLFLAVSLMVGGVVSVCGPIGFVGMMSPHIVRLLVGANHRAVGPATVLFGGAFLVLCDTLARTVIAPAEIPVGVITALLGGPFFLWLLLGESPERSIMR